MTHAPRPLVLVVDDREDISEYCRRSLASDFEFRRVTGGRSALLQLADQGVAVVLLDRDFSHADSSDLLGPRDDARDEGLHILRAVRRAFPDVPVIMVTGQRETRAALSAAELGADFLAWDDVLADPGVLEARLRHALESSSVGRDVVVTRFRELGIVTESPAFQRALHQLWRSLPGTAPILLLGETGTGKDTLAYAAHALRNNSVGRYVEVNVASLSPELIASELFGHARGAFTNADREHVGKLQWAHGGTLFMNEFGELAPEVQVKLLTALERREVTPVGSVRSVPAEFRLVTATSRDLRSLVKLGQFREDLYQRIAWHTVEIPPLRERPEDVTPLANAQLLSSPQHASGQLHGFAREALEYLGELPWPGNVRELKRVVSSACANAVHVVTVRDIHEAVRRTEIARSASAALGPGAPTATDAGGKPPARLEPAAAEDLLFEGRTHRELTRAYYRWLVRKAGGRLPEVARLAGLSKATVYEWRDRFRGDDRESPSDEG